MVRVSKVSEIFRKYDQEEKSLSKAILNITGKKPLHIGLYKLATLHSSASTEKINGNRESNERLEFLGDAVLDLVIAGYLFRKFPFKDEGFLTDIRARMVNRESLNWLALKIGIPDIIKFNKTPKSVPRSILGNALEAIVGAVFLDRGYAFCKNFVEKKLIIPHLDINEIIQNNPNQKSIIIEWAQKENHDLRFETVNVNEDKKRKEFTVQIFVDDKPIGKGFGLSKKKAEQDAAQKSCEMLKLSL